MRFSGPLRARPDSSSPQTLFNDLSGTGVHPVHSGILPTGRFVPPDSTGSRQGRGVSVDDGTRRMST